MSTQKSIEEIVEEFESQFCYEIEGEMVVTCFEPNDCTMEDWSAWQITDWLYTTLQAERNRAEEEKREAYNRGIRDGAKAQFQGIGQALTNPQDNQ